MFRAPRLAAGLVLALALAGCDDSDDDASCLDPAGAPAATPTATLIATSGGRDAEWRRLVPHRVAVGPDQNLYMISQLRWAVTVVSREGEVLRSFAGTGRYAGNLGLPVSLAIHPNGDVYVLDASRNLVVVFNPFGRFERGWSTRTGDPAGTSELSDIAIDSHGYVYVADRTAHWVKKFDSSGVHQLWWTGHDGYRFTGPVALAVDHEDRVYVADGGGTTPGRVFAYDGDGTLLREYGEAEFGRAIDPIDLAVDRSGDVYVTDRDARRVLRSGDGGTPPASIGSAGAYRISLFAPEGLALDAEGSLYVTDRIIIGIHEFDADGGPIRVILRPRPRPGLFSYLIDLAVAPSGCVYALDAESGFVHEMTRGGATVDAWGDIPDQPAGMRAARYIDTDASGNIYVLSWYSAHVNKFDAVGRRLLFWQGTVGVSQGLAIGDNGVVYTIGGDVVERHTLDGTPLDTWTADGAQRPFQGLVAVAVDPDDNVYLVDELRRTIDVYSPAGERLRSITPVGYTAWTSSMDLAVDAEGRLYVTSTRSPSVDIFGPDGTRLTTPGGSPLVLPVDASPPGGITIDEDGAIYVATETSLISRFAPLTPTPPASPR